MRKYEIPPPPQSTRRKSRWVLHSCSRGAYVPIIERRKNLKLKPAWQAKTTNSNGVRHHLKQQEESTTCRNERKRKRKISYELRVEVEVELLHSLHPIQSRVPDHEETQQQQRQQQQQ